MKGGGLVVVVFIIVFTFLFVCTLWGISAIVGEVGQVFSSKCKRLDSESWSQARRQVLVREQVPPPSASRPSTPAVPDKTTVPERTDQHDMDQVLEKLERISRLHKEGMLTEEEVTQFKTLLIQEIQCN